MKKWFWKNLVPRGIKALYWANKEDVKARDLGRVTDPKSHKPKQIKCPTDNCIDVSHDKKMAAYAEAKTAGFIPENEFLLIEPEKIKYYQGGGPVRPDETDPGAHVMFPMQVCVMVKQGDQSPVDMMAARIARQIIGQGLCKLKVETMAGGYEKYVLEVVIAKKKQ